MKLRPLQDRVLIRRVDPEAKTAGGIFIPDGRAAGQQGFPLVDDARNDNNEKGPRQC